MWVYKNKVTTTRLAKPALLGSARNCSKVVKPAYAPLGQRGATLSALVKNYVIIKASKIVYNSRRNYFRGLNYHINF